MTDIFIDADDSQKVAEWISGVTVAEVRVSDSVIQEASMKHCCKQWCGHAGSSEFTMGESSKLKDQVFERFALSRICTANLN